MRLSLFHNKFIFFTVIGNSQSTVEIPIEYFCVNISPTADRKYLDLGMLV